MAKNTRKYPNRDEEDLRETNRKLKARLRNAQKQIKILKSENESLLDAWSKTEAFLSEITEGVPLEKVLQYRTLPKSAIKEKTKENNEMEDIKEEARKQWAKWAKEKL